MNKKKVTLIWLILSSFGIMFAVLSWIQESISNDIFSGYQKGVLAVITGIVLYYFIAKKTI